MMVASWEGHHGIIETLLSADADPNLQDGVSELNCNHRIKTSTN